MLRDAEHWLRTLGDGYDRDLGVNLAAQGLGLVQHEHHGPAARRLREALTLLDDLGYEHPADLMLMSTRLAAVELQLFGPVAGLKRLHAGQHYQRFCSIEVLFEAASVRGQLLQALDSQECERDYYMSPGQYQRCANAISDSVDACCEAIDSLMLGGDKKSAVGLASNCLSELLTNRNLSSVDLQDATDRLRSSFYETNG